MQILFRRTVCAKWTKVFAFVRRYPLWDTLVGVKYSVSCGSVLPRKICDAVKNRQQKTTCRSIANKTKNNRNSCGENTHEHNDNNLLFAPIEQSPVKYDQITAGEYSGALCWPQSISCWYTSGVFFFFSLLRTMTVFDEISDTWRLLVPTHRRSTNGNAWHSKLTTKA